MEGHSCSRPWGSFTWSCLNNSQVQFYFSKAKKWHLLNEENNISRLLKEGISLK